MLELLKEIFGEELSADAATRIESWLEEHYQPKALAAEADSEAAEADSAEAASVTADLAAVEAARQEAYQQAEAEFTAAAEELKFDYALNVALLQVGVVDLDLIKVKLNRATLTMTESGEIVGLSEQLAEIRESFPMLFTREPGSVELFGVKPAAVGDPESSLTRAELEKMTYKERVKLLHSNPALYHSILG